MGLKKFSDFRELGKKEFENGETRHVSLHQLDLLEYNDENGNPIKRMTMPSPSTIYNLELYI